MAVPQKIVLKSTTKLTLNERFGSIRPVAAMAMMSQSRSQAAVASQRNRRLAQQMANRPAVQAALRSKKVGLQHRLGAHSIKSRLDLPAVPRGRGWGRGRGYRSTIRGNRGAPIRGQRGLFRGAFTTRGGFTRGGGGRPYMFRGTRGGSFRSRGGRGGRRGIGRGLARGRGRARRGQPLSREHLDNQLEAYMSGTKAQLDHDLENYMHPNV